MERAHGDSEPSAAVPRTTPPEAERSVPLPAGPAAPDGARRPPDGWGRRAAVLAAALALAWLAVNALWLLARPLALLLAAVAIALSLAPVIDWLQRWIPRLAAILLVTALVALTFGALGWLIVPALVRQAQELVQQGPRLIEQAGDWIERSTPLSTALLESELQARFGQVLGLLVALPLTIVSVVAEILLVAVIAIYWLIGAPPLLGFVLSLAPPERRGALHGLLTNLSHSIGGYLRGVVINALIVSTLTYVGLLIIGLEFALVLALVAGLAEFVPVVGPFIAAIPAIILAALQSPTLALIVAAFYLVLQQFEGNVLMPRVMAAQTDVPPVLGLFALIVGGSLGGILGALIALPVAAAIVVLARQVMAPAIRRWTGAT